MSVAKITDRDFKVVFTKDSATIADANGNVALYAERLGDLYYIREHDESACSASSGNPKRFALELMHRKFGHANTRDIADAINKGVISGVEIEPSVATSACHVCLKGKMKRISFPKNSDRSTEICDIIHTDVCGPMRTTSLGGAKYYVEFIDDRSKWCEVRFLKYKSDVLEATKAYIALVEKTDRKVCALVAVGQRRGIRK